MFIIAVGDCWNGASLYCKDDGPFDDYEEAAEYAERHFHGETWYVVTVEPHKPE